MLRRMLPVAAMVASLGCAQVLGLDDLVPDREPSGSSAGSGAAGGGAGQCTGKCGDPGCGVCPTRLEVDVPDAEPPYRIDVHEVTVGEYRVFVEANVSPHSQEGSCVHNDSFEPGIASTKIYEVLGDGGSGTSSIETQVADCAAWLNDELMGDQRPVVCIDQCDARAYCAWSKQRLCGRAGGGVLDVSQDESQDMLSKAEGSHADPSQSQWYGACSTGEVSTYPYGDGYVAGRCVDNSVASRVQDVGSRAECMGGYAGLFDMSGNAEEWEDACTQFTTPPLLQNCLVRGGSVDHPGSGQLRPGELPLLACAASRGLAQGFIYTTVGFRCCADD